MEIIKEPNAVAAAYAAGVKLNEVLNGTAVAASHVLLLLSGGSSLDILSSIDGDNLGSNVTVTVLDERYSSNPEENNFSQIATTGFYDLAKSKGVNFIETTVKGLSQEQLAEEFNKQITEWLKNNPGGKIIATIGIGPDGHTAGMMPHPENPEKFGALFDDGDENKLVTPYDATGRNKYPARITTNMNFMRKIDTAIVYAVGEEKKNAITRVQASKGTLPETPARILREIKGKVYLFTDIAV
jgi:6-phosphogluconolactonase/glucosamine-6-phosphate isomerase/deaminase